MKDAEEYKENLKKFLDQARRVKLRLNENKCKFELKEVSYVGHVFTETWPKSHPSIIKAITEMPTPKDKAALKCFLGMVTYLGKI